MNETNLIAMVFGVLLSLLPELIPPFRAKWDGVTAEWKKAIRGWAGLVILIVLLALDYGLGIDLGFGAVFDVQALITAVSAWIAFVLSAEGTYQMAGPILPRKR